MTLRLLESVKRQNKLRLKAPTECVCMIKIHLQSAGPKVNHRLLQACQSEDLEASHRTRRPMEKHAVPHRVRNKHFNIYGSIFIRLFVHVYLVNSENVSDKTSSHTVELQDTSPREKPVEIVATQMTVSPTWYLSVGDTVEINCSVIEDKGNYSHNINLLLIWTKMGSTEKTKTVLMSQRASTGISYVLGPVTHEHQGMYSCDDDGSLPDVFVNMWHRIIWVADAFPSASADVISHNRSQFFSNERFTLGCQLPDPNTQWKMMRYDQYWGTITACPDQDSSRRGLTCTSSSQYPWSDILYWCESPTGERSNALNITTTVGVNVTLESPPLPVLEGEDVLLRCLHRNETTKQITSNFRAVFYKNKRRIRIQTQGNLTLSAVTKADEGMYMCRHPEEGPSHYSWITVKSDEDQKL
ncbi:uncharacterized protein LOC110003297 [Xyrichtys novacula]|uniref:Uncharacterized protein LOC110003297 n=1 Tax=Xyrichtys novacula TaxID=13765 RepID=A0AAV1HIV9_XYRNO|nr:uncharacterized protein LOC110003297 [Xyrichtys novacula]